MKRFSLIVACFLFMALQMIVVPHVAIGQVAPDLIFLLVAFFAVGRSTGRASIFGFVIGLIQDLFNPQLLGLNALTKSLSGYALSIGGSKVDVESLSFLFALFGVGAVAHDFVYLIFFTGMQPLKFLLLWTTVSLPSGVYTAAVGVVVYRLSQFLGWKVVRTVGKARS